MVENGGMELFPGGDNPKVPIDWTSTTPSRISQEMAQGRVHSGQFSVSLTFGDNPNTNLSQIVENINPGCFYNFSFFAHAEGQNVGLIATVTFLDMDQNPILTNSLTISVRNQDLQNSNRSFGYYRAITPIAPIGAQFAEIKFVITSDTSGLKEVDIDDVSFSVE